MSPLQLSRQIGDDTNLVQNQGACMTMTPEQEQALEEHIRAIGKILYEDTPTEQLTTLAGPIASCPGSDA